MLPEGNKGRYRGPNTIALALYQPDIPQATGAMLRLAACLGLTATSTAPA